MKLESFLVKNFAIKDTQRFEMDVILCYIYIYIYNNLCNFSSVIKILS